MDLSFYPIINVNNVFSKYGIYRIPNEELNNFYQKYGSNEVSLENRRGNHLLRYRKFK